MEEFRISNAKNAGMPNKHVETSPVAEQFYSTMSELPDIQLMTGNQALNDEASSCSDDDNASDISDISRTEALQIASFNGKTDIKVTVKVISCLDIYRMMWSLCSYFINFQFQQALSMQGPKVQLELQLGAVNIFLTPRQLHALIQLTDTFLTESTKKASMQNLNRLVNDNDQASEYKAFNAMSGNLGLNHCWSSDPLGNLRFSQWNISIPFK